MSPTDSGKFTGAATRLHIAQRPGAQPRADDRPVPDHVANQGAAAMTAARPPRQITPARVRHALSAYRPYDDPSNYLG